ncbi:metallohydrolase [Veillonella parvula]|uniref:Kae1-like domain-containing protein n=1 Tax=Veillonella parvula TaxID=29466 RepID=UPI002905028A|nr:metallohydrolase [Veillonella parvula]MDU1045480.1 metallohydrolase [Veillonella parvula]
MKRYYLGIDTSCYTTSCAIVDSDFHIVGETRKILEVKLGERGLQQSNMVFQHTKVLPKLMSELPQVPISGIGVSGFPRREERSYMPAFMVGLGQGQTLSHLMNVPLHIFAHQENHILAALRDLKNIPNEPFLALHLSGGTTELVYCHYQVDRIGVALGLPFPAGKHLEALALQTTEYEPLPSSVKNGWISFAGPCSAAMRRINNAMSDIDKSKLARAVFTSIGNALEKMITYHTKEKSVRVLIAVGGVMSNSLLRKRMETYCKRNHLQLHVAQPQFSVDNATGNAFGAAYLQKSRG